MSLKRLSNEKGPVWPWLTLLFFGVLAILLLNSCTTTKEMRRANKAANKLEKLVDRYPELQRTDTIRDTIKVVIPEVKVDTVVLKSDTIEVSKDRWRVRIITKMDSVYIDGGFDADTVYVPIQVPCDTIQATKPVYIDRPLSWWEEILSGAGKLALILILFLIAIRIIQKWMSQE